MWNVIFSLIVHCSILFYIVGMELKNQGHEKVKTKAGKAFYWIVWIICVVGNIWLILGDIVDIIWSSEPTSVFIVGNYSDLIMPMVIIILVLALAIFLFKKKGKK